jgi:putative tricarboxylic transport membrane protein
MTLLFSTRYIAKLIHVPNRFLGGFIMILSFVGVYSIRNSLADCVFAVVFGYIGYIFRRLNWPLVPVVLGLVLGSIIIERLSAGSGQIKSAADFINRPVSGTLFFVILLVIGFIVYSSISNRRINYQ